MQFKSILKPEGSVISGIAVAGSVWAIYQLDMGNVASVHMSDANHGALEPSRKKAAYTSFAFVSIITLLTRDANVGVLGYGSIIAMELHYRHAIMVDPFTHTMQPPGDSVYQPAAQIVPADEQGYSYP